MTKKIEAIIREEALDAVKDALHAIGIVGMNVVDIPKGSSRSSILGAVANARAIPTRCCMPCDSCFTLRSSASPRPTSSR